MVAATAVERLPAMNAQGDRFTVSGLSSGAYMAVQVAVAHSARVGGVGVFAGGPYYCVGINAARIEKPCMEGNPGADGSIHILSGDGKPLDRFNYGAALHGLATTDIDGKPALIVASAEGVEALRVE